MSRENLVAKKYPKFVNEAKGLADPKHNNKYLLWIASQLSKGYNGPDIKGTVDSFHKESKRLTYQDIYKYEDLKTLENEIKNLELSNRELIKSLKTEGTTFIYEDDNCKCLRIDMKDAAIYYGANTKWCITMANSHYFEEYLSEGVIFYLLLGKKSGRKLMLSYHYDDYNGDRDEIFDETDNEVFGEGMHYWFKNYQSEFGSAVSFIYNGVKHEESFLYKISCDSCKSFNERELKYSDVVSWLEKQHGSTKDYVSCALDFYIKPLSDLSINDIVEMGYAKIMKQINNENKSENKSGNKSGIEHVIRLLLNNNDKDKKIKDTKNCILNSIDQRMVKKIRREVGKADALNKMNEFKNGNFSEKQIYALLNNEFLNKKEKQKLVRMIVTKGKTKTSTKKKEKQICLQQ